MTGYHEFTPHPQLQDAVKCYWVLERDFEAIDGGLDVLPDSYVDIIFNMGSSCRITHEQTVVELPACYVVTQFDKPFRLQSTGVLRTIGIRLYAWGIAPLNIDDATAGTIHPLEGVWRSLSERLRVAGTEQIKDMLDNALLPRLSQRNMSEATQPLRHWRGELKVNELAERCHLSMRQLERQLQDKTGLTPKALSRKLRFEQARDRLSQNPHTDLSQLAAECGYADQSHLSREFKHYSNRTLRQFVAEIDPFEQHLRFGVSFNA